MKNSDSQPESEQEISQLVLPNSRNKISGLINGIDYKFNKDGSINWRAMVKSEHLFPNKSWFELRKKPTPDTIEGLLDHQLLIKLSGIKELAKLRGYKSVKYDIIKCEPNYVSIKCGITWTPNYESDHETYFEDVANATNNNTSDFAIKFLETIAANRAFVRAVRNFLNIHIVGSDEIDSSKNKKNSAEEFEEDMEVGLPSSQAMLEKVAKSKGLKNFTQFLEYIQNAEKIGVYQSDRNIYADNWTSYGEVPTKEARIWISILKDS